LILLLLLTLLIFGFPSVAAWAAGKYPKGGAQGCAPFCAGHGMSRTQNPVDQADPAREAGGARRQGVLSFGYFSLHKQRKVTRSKAKRERKLLTLLLLLPFTTTADNSLRTTIANTLVRPEGARFTQYQWTDPPSIIALYFGANWCGPCHAFTPQLREVYTTLRAKGANTEVVYVSLDTSESDMRRYMRTAQMPWPAITPRRLRNLPAIGALAGPAPPNLVLIGEDGQIIASAWDGRRYLGLHGVLQQWVEAFPDPP